MKTGYLVWVNDEQFWHADLKAAQRRANRAERSGHDTLIVAFEVHPYIVDTQQRRKAA
jgi:hypothetical protein